LIYAMKSLRTNVNKKMTVPEVQNLKMEVLTSIQEKMVPNVLVQDYLQKSYTSFDDFWLFRKQFTKSFAALTFMTYVMNMNNRFPHKMFISRSTGNVWGTELIPALAASNAYFHNNEPVPFRLTPNLHVLMGPIGVEGLFSTAIMAIAKCLTEPEVSSVIKDTKANGAGPPAAGANGTNGVNGNASTSAATSATNPSSNSNTASATAASVSTQQFELEQHLSLFVRDEMIFWFTQQHRSAGASAEQKIREKVDANSMIIVRRTTSLCATNNSQSMIPANQTVIDLISKAVNPANLAQTDHLWMPYL